MAVTCWDAESSSMSRYVSLHNCNWFVSLPTCRLIELLTTRWIRKSDRLSKFFTFKTIQLPGVCTLLDGVTTKGLLSLPESSQQFFIVIITPHWNRKLINLTPQLPTSNYPLKLTIIIQLSHQPHDMPTTNANILSPSCPSDRQTDLRRGKWHKLSGTWIFCAASVLYYMTSENICFSPQPSPR